MIKKDEIFNVVKGLKGVSYGEIMGIFPEEPSYLLDNCLEELINSGLITNFKEVFYPIVRSIGIIPKGQNETVNEIVLNNFSVEQIRSAFQPNHDDPLFYDGYHIDESKTLLFAQFDSVKFDFNQFDYYLLCGFDNSTTFQ